MSKLLFDADTMNRLMEDYKNVLSERDELATVVKLLVNRADSQPFMFVGHYVEHFSHAREVLAGLQP